MARLIIGHTTHNSARIWVRGHPRYPVAVVNVKGGRSRTTRLEERHGYTGFVDFKGLKPKTPYECQVRFAEDEKQPPEHHVGFGECDGRFTTFPAEDSAGRLKFLLGSCNLHSLGPISRPAPAYRRLTSIALSEKAGFMIHCGDQIYYDVPIPHKPPSIEEYREKYLDAWNDSRATRKFLTLLPHYMILDDHEMINNFANDMDTPASGASPEEIRDASLKAYREFQHIHNPDSYGSQALYYDFAFGKYRFFVLDARTERYGSPRSEETRIISDEQMTAFCRWLEKHKGRVKFVVTSVPFVAEAKHSRDKWNADVFAHQREQIMGFLLEKEIGGVTFLTGDRHNSHHATLEILNDSRRVVVHELMSSPINQIGKSSYDAYRSGEKQTSGDGRFSYTSVLKKSEFYCDHSNAMLITATGRNVHYEVFRTKRDRRNELAGSFSV